MESLVRHAQSGSRQALEQLIDRIQGRVYEMSLRMLGHPSDAEDAAQEILIKVITHLGGFRGNSAFFTWVYRIAANHLLTTRKRRAERMGLSFDLFEDNIDRGGDIPPVPDPEQQLLMEEFRSNCIQAILVCLNRDLRLAFILGDIFGVTGKEGADILDVTPATFRKRLSRSRARVHRFMKKNCGLVHPANPCQCRRQFGRDVENGWFDPAHPVYVETGDRAPSKESLADTLQGMEAMGRIALLFKTYPRNSQPDDFAVTAKSLLAISARP
jgi:RNA polymerase sigma factor (sigma-70 family)